MLPVICPEVILPICDAEMVPVMVLAATLPIWGAEMVPWTRGLGDDYQDMIDRWDRLGVVVDRGSPETPFFVEQERDQEALGP